jgi:hypothetical protein
MMAVGGIACTWLVPDDYNLGLVLNVSLQFFEAQASFSFGNMWQSIASSAAGLLLGDN